MGGVPWINQRDSKLKGGFMKNILYYSEIYNFSVHAVLLGEDVTSVLESVDQIIDIKIFIFILYVRC
jgi:hypothetical protein